MSNIKKFETPNDLLKDMMPAIKRALPQHKDPQRFATIILTVLNKNPKLMECTTGSLMGAIMLTSVLGLELGDHLGQAYIIPYKTKGVILAQFQIGYRGYPTLLTNSIIYAHNVYDGEKFHYQYGLNKDLVHIPDPKCSKNKIIASYAVIKNTNGFADFLVMHREELDKVKNVSKATESPAWKNWEGEMYRKIPLKRLCKTAPLSAEDKKKVMQDETTKIFTPGMKAEHVLDLPDETDWTNNQGSKYDKEPPEKKKAEVIPEQQIDEEPGTPYPTEEETTENMNDKNEKPTEEKLQKFEEELIKTFDGDADMVEKWLSDNTKEYREIFSVNDINSVKQLNTLKGKLRK